HPLRRGTRPGVRKGRRHGGARDDPRRDRGGGQGVLRPSRSRGQASILRAIGAKSMRPSMKRISIITGIAGAACLIAGGASAQSAGTFSGTSTDGAFITFNVTKVGSTFTVGTSDVNMQALCKHTGLTANEGWGFFLGDDISSGSTDFTSHNDYYY